MGVQLYVRNKGQLKLPTLIHHVVVQWSMTWVSNMFTPTVDGKISDK